MDAARGPIFCCRQGRGSSTRIWTTYSAVGIQIQVPTTNAGARAEGGLTPDFFALSSELSSLAGASRSKARRLRSAISQWRRPPMTCLYGGRKAVGGHSQASMKLWKPPKSRVLRAPRRKTSPRRDLLDREIERPAGQACATTINSDENFGAG